jgi:hypothetical protein
MESLESREKKRKGSLFRQSDSYLNFFLLLVKGEIRIIYQRKIPKNLTCSYETVTITSTMPLNFASDPAAEPTTIYHDDDDFFTSDDGTEGTGHNSRVSASEFDGDVKTDMTDHILFSELECRGQVTTYKNNPEGTVRVCGNKFSLCGRAHFGALRYGPGVYKTIAGRGKFIDGIVGTCITEEEYQEILRQEAAERGRNIAEARMLLGGQEAEEDLKPSSSKESVYRAQNTIQLL